MCRRGAANARPPVRDRLQEKEQGHKRRIKVGQHEFPPHRLHGHSHPLARAHSSTHPPRGTPSTPRLTGAPLAVGRPNVRPGSLAVLRLALLLARRAGGRGGGDLVSLSDDDAQVHMQGGEEERRGTHDDALLLADGRGVLVRGRLGLGRLLLPRSRGTVCGGRRKEVSWSRSMDGSQAAADARPWPEPCRA